MKDVKGDTFRYQLNTSIFFPYGACDLKLYSKGKVWFEFDSANCINYLEYITDYKKSETFWGYLKDKELCTNSITFKEINPER